MKKLLSLLNVNGYSSALISGLQLNKANGLEEAKAFPCGPNCTIAIFDSNEDTFYIKATDAYGAVTSFRIFDGFKERVDLPPLDERYVTVDQLNAFKEELIGEIRNAQQFVQQPTYSTDARSGKPNGIGNGTGKTNDDASKLRTESNSGVVEVGNDKSSFGKDNRPNQ